MFCYLFGILLYIATLPVNYGQAIKSVYLSNGVWVNDTWFGVTRSGAPGRVVEQRGGVLLNTYAMPGSTGAWNIIEHAGTLYVGTYEKANLYSISGGVVTLLVNIPEDSFVWDIVYYNNAIYMGTYPTGRVLKYDLGTGALTNLGTFSNGGYARTLEIYNGKLYVGIGTTPGLIEYDFVTGERRDLLPATYHDDGFVYDLQVVGNTLFAGLTPSGRILTWDGQAVKGANLVNAATLDIAQITPFQGLWNQLFGYSSSTGALTLFPQADNAGIRLHDGQVESISIDGVYAQSDPAGMIREEHSLQIEPSPTQAYSLATDARRVYIAERQLRIFDPTTRAEQYNALPGEAKAMQVYSATLYAAIYPSARVYAYPVANLPLGNLKDARYLLAAIGHSQNRPLALRVDAAGVLVGTEPDYGKFGGALTVIDPATKKVDVYRNIVPDQSIRSLAATEDVVYAGSGAWGGSGYVAAPAQIVKVERSTGRVLWRSTPKDAASAITSLALYGPALWATTDDGDLYRLNPTTGASEHVTTDPLRELFVFDRQLYGFGEHTFGPFAATTPPLTQLQIDYPAPTLTPDGLYFLNGQALFYLESPAYYLFFPFTGGNR